MSPLCFSCVLLRACGLQPSPEPCLFCCRYGFNSHGHDAVERRLRARQETQLRLTGGETSLAAFALGVRRVGLGVSQVAVG